MLSGKRIFVQREFEVSWWSFLFQSWFRGSKWQKVSWTLLSPVIILNKCKSQYFDCNVQKHLNKEKQSFLIIYKRKVVYKDFEPRKQSLQFQSWFGISAQSRSLANMTVWRFNYAWMQTAAFQLVIILSVHTGRYNVFLSDMGIVVKYEFGVRKENFPLNKCLFNWTYNCATMRTRN